MKKWRSALILFLACLISDQAVKWWTVATYQIPKMVFQTSFGLDFYLDYAQNTGGAWGMLSDFHIPLLLFRICIVIFLTFYLFRRNGGGHPLAITTIIAGAIGNVIDCFMYGHVVDMFHFTFWGNSYGIFNLADLWIFIGAVLLLFPSRGKEEKLEG